MPDYAATGMLRKRTRNLARKGTPPSDGIDALDAAPADSQVIIAIEPVACDVATFPAGSRIVMIPFRALTKPLLAETGAVLVVGPLVSPHLDAMQIAERLGKLGFCGSLRVLGPALPNPALVSREIRTASGSKEITVEVVAAP